MTDYKDPRTTFSPFRIGQVLINSIRENKNPELTCPDVFHMEDHELMERIQATRERATVCASCKVRPEGALCSYECIYDGLPGKPTITLERWVLPWENNNGSREGA